MAVVSKLSLRSTLSLYSMRTLLLAVILRLIQHLVSGKPQRKRGKDEEMKLDSKFWRRFGSLLKICVPSVFSKEAVGVAFFTALLLLRTKLTLLLASTIGRNGKYLVQRNFKAFAFGVVDIGLLSIPGAGLQIGIQYTKMMVQQMLRDNLQSALQNEYLKGNNVYVIATTNILDNPDHRIAQDANMFCKGVADLFRSVLKPLLDVATLSRALARRGGVGAPGFIVSYYALVAALTSTLLPNFATLIAKSQEKEGNLRAKHSQLVAHAEEVAFYNGEEIEQQRADKLLRSVVKHEKRIKYVKLVSGIIDALLIKHGAVCLGYLVCGAVALDLRDTLTKDELLEEYLETTQLYIPLSNAVGKLLLLRKKVGAVCGSTHRVGELMETLQKITATTGKISTANYFEKADSEEIVFSDVTIATPANDELVTHFNLRIERGKHVLVMGSNGSGKSAIVRAMSKLWPIKCGSLEMPSGDRVKFLPQRVYLPPGNLRDQLIYPLTSAKAAAHGITDEDIYGYAASLGLVQLINREGGLDNEQNWQEVLSGGERQRLALVRLLVQRPMFAVMDECTSAVSQDDEPRLYAELQKAGITLITISHRESLKLTHNTLLELDGNGGYRVSDCGN